MSTVVNRHRTDEPVELLLVEDNQGDVRLTREAFEMAGVDVSIRAVPTVDEALTLLSAGRDDGPESCPDLVLLDLNLPGADGFDLLEWIRADPVLAPLPVLVLTSSAAAADVETSYEMSANAFLTKPDTPKEFVWLARSIESFWLDAAELPIVPSGR